MLERERQIKNVMRNIKQRQFIQSNYCKTKIIICLPNYLLLSSDSEDKVDVNNDYGCVSLKNEVKSISPLQFMCKEYINKIDVDSVQSNPSNEDTFDTSRDTESVFAALHFLKLFILFIVVRNLKKITLRLIAFILH